MGNKPLTVLKRNSEFKNLKLKGRWLKLNPWLLVNFRTGQSDQMRCGWTISRQVGKATVRNRLKRWCRQVLREKNSIDPLPLDIVLVFRKMQGDFYRTVKFTEFEQAIIRSWSKIAKSC